MDGVDGQSEQKVKRRHSEQKRTKAIGQGAGSGEGGGASEGGERK